MVRRLTDEAIRCLALFEEITDVEAVDCVIDDEYDRVVIVVAQGRLADAIGHEGQTVRRVEQRLNRDVHLVEFADTPEDFVANSLRPAAIYAVHIDDGVANVEVADRDRGVAIGSDGQTIELARELAKRHFDIDEVRIE